MTTLHLKKSIGRSPLRRGLLLIPLMLACFALLPSAQAVTPELLPAPPPDGAYTGFNTAEGLNALFNLTSGQFNTALGFAVLKADNSGSHNTGMGAQALLQNTIGSYNTAVGENAMVSNIDGVQNMALGQGALAHNLHGDNNTAMGFQALLSNTADNNTAVGWKALTSNTGPVNTATGAFALPSNTTGDSNNATGFEALFKNTTGVWNEAYGFDALFNNVSGSENTAIGDSAGFNITGSLNIDIGSAVYGVPGESNVTRIGLATGGSAQTACYIGGIYGVTVATGVSVGVTSDGQLGVLPASSARFKDEIKPMEKVSEAILALKPVTFHYKQKIDPKGIPQFGLVAEEVAKVNPDLVTRDAKGEVYTVRYEAVNAMLLNEFLKEHRKVEQLKKDFECKLAQQQKQIEALTAGLQKVSAQVQISKPASQTIVDNH